MPYPVSAVRSKGGNVVAPWWLAGGTPVSSCVIAYQPLGATSQAASYINLANPGTYDAVVGSTPGWASATGWTFGGGKYLRTTYVARGNQQGSVLARVANFTTSGNLCVCGANSGGYFFLLQWSSSVANYWNGGSPRASSIGTLSAGVIGIAGAFGWRQGVKDGAAIPGGATDPLVEMYIGGYNGGSLLQACGVDVLAWAEYNTVLSDSQMTAISIAMNALTG